MGVTPSRSRAWRWVRVVVARTAMRRSRPRRTTLRVSVARSPSRVWKLCTGSGSSSAGSVRLRAALRCAAGEGSAVATGEVRCASRAAGSGSSNSIGARLQMLRHVADQLRQKWPKLAAFIDDSETDGLSYLDFPEQHRSKLHSTNPLARLNKEVKRRADVVGIFPNEAAIIRLIGAVLLEQNDEWQLQHRYIQVEVMAELAAPAATDPRQIPCAA